jgi:hypothetical protein
MERSQAASIASRASREELQPGSFRRRVPSSRNPEEIPATIYDYYCSQKPWKDFPFSPDDTYSEILHDDPADIDNDATVLLGRLGLILVPGYIRELYGDKPIETLREMVLWLDWMRQHQPKSVQSE